MDGIEAALVDIDLKWCVLMHLFSSKKTLDLLNETAPSFFHLIQELLISDIVLSIARLMDRPQICGKSTLSMKGFSARIADAGTRTTYVTIINEIASQLGDLSAWRHKKLAHNDLKKALRLERLPDLRIDNLDRIISLIADACNIVGGADKRPPYVRNMAYQPGGCDALLRCLKPTARRR